MTNRLTVRTAVDPKAANELDKLRGKFDKMRAQGAKGLLVGAGVAATQLAFNAVGNAIGAVTDLIGDSKRAFLEDEASIAKLGQTLDANVKAWDGNTDAIEETIASRMKLGFSDDEQRESLNTLVIATGDATEALDIQRTAMDLARLKGISLAEASEALTKVEGGQYRALKGLGIELKKGATATDALRAVQEATEGQADSFAGTLQGRLASAAVRTQEAMEHLGEATAEFSADFEEAKAGVFESGVKAIDDIVDSINLDNQTTERQIYLKKQAIETIQWTTQAAKDLALAEIDLEYAVQDGTSEMARLNMETADATPHMADAGGEAEDLADDLEEVEDAAKGAAREVSNLASALSTELFGDAIDAGKEAALLQRIKDIKKEMQPGFWKTVTTGGKASKEAIGDAAESLRIAKMRLAEMEAKGTASGSSLASARNTVADAAKRLAELEGKHATTQKVWVDGTKKGSLAYIELQGELAGARAGLFELNFEMAQKEGPEALDAFLDKTIAAMGYADGAALKYALQLKALNKQLERYNDLGTVTFGRYEGKILPGLAAGGPVEARTPYLVGERGPEVFVPREAGQILPNSALDRSPGRSAFGLAGGAAPVSIPIYLDGRRIAEVVDEHLYYRRASAPR